MQRNIFSLDLDQIDIDQTSDVTSDPEYLKILADLYSTAMPKVDQPVQKNNDVAAVKLQLEEKEKKRKLQQSESSRRYRNKQKHRLDELEKNIKQITNEIETLKEERQKALQEMQQLMDVSAMIAYRDVGDFLSIFGKKDASSDISKDNRQAHSPIKKI